MPLLSSAQVKDELARCREAVEASGIEFDTVDGAALMRPRTDAAARRPCARCAPRAMSRSPVGHLLRLGNSATRHKVAHRASRAIEGDVIFLHDGGNLDSRPIGSHSVAATEDTLKKFRAEGYEFVTVPELGRRNVIAPAFFITDFWNDQLVEHDRQWMFLVLAGLVLSFGFIRLDPADAEPAGAVVARERRQRRWAARSPPGVRDRADDRRRDDQLRRLRRQPDL